MLTQPYAPHHTHANALDAMRRFGVAKKMMDPVTVEKIQMVKSTAELIEKMKRDDIDYDQMPSWLGGRASHPGTSMEVVGREYVQQFAAAQRAKAEAAAAAAAAAPKPTAGIIASPPAAAPKPPPPAGSRPPPKLRRMTAPPMEPLGVPQAGDSGAAEKSSAK